MNLKKRNEQHENVNKFQPKKNKRKFKLEKQITKKWNRKKEKEMQINFFFAMITLGRTEITINFFSQNEMS